MKRILVLVVVLFALKVQAREPFVNEICLPSKLYLMQGVSNEIYSPSFTKRWRPYDDFVRYGGTVEYAKGGRLDKGAVINRPQTGDTLEVMLVNSDYFDTLMVNRSVVYAATPSVGEKRVVVQFLGDSFTRGGYFKYAFVESGYVPNVELVGTRYLGDSPQACHEGRGGWSIFDYFSSRPDGEHIQNPFYQPVGEYRFWGNTAFWRNAVGLKSSSQLASFDLRYNCGDYNTERFGVDGYLLEPQKSDVMYDSDKGCYVEWRGGAWRQVALGDEWDFDYSKYLDMWGIEAPDFLVIYLGLNDFKHHNLPNDYTLWNELVNKVLLCYRSVVPNGRLVLSTPCSSSGTNNSENGKFSTLQNAVMWELRRNIIENFDGREAEGVYVVDASLTLDNETSYNLNQEGLQVGNPHPYPAYPSLGIPIAAFVQYYRDR